uniref:Uncharacterized protein n=1 Tax=uncultured prokaryote TaxID=198431 RepID=A0A0H5Q5T4_9ZZZZ|nr:hypothetical protein [uncultured prokaryote]
MARVAGVGKINILYALEQGILASWGVWTLPSTPANAAAWNATIASLNTALATPLQTLATKTLAKDEYITGISGYYYAGAGDATYEASQTASYIGAPAAARVYPMQVALVGTLRTGEPGAASRGRVYIPVAFWGTTLAAGGQVNATDLASYCSDLGAVLDVINDAVNLVVSSVAQSKATPVTQLTIDSRFDIQRRRADKQRPLYRSSQTIT